MSRILTILVISFFLFTSGALEAASWGRTKETVNFAGDTWTQVYMNLENLNLKAFIPNYSKAVFHNGYVHLIGQRGSDIGYIIQTSYNPTFEILGGSQEELVVAVQKANPQYYVVPVGIEIPGVDCAVDLIPNEKGTTAFWRFLWASNRLIEIGTDDSDVQCRSYFFDSVKLD